MPKDAELFNLPCLVVHKKSKPVLIFKTLIRSVINYWRYLVLLWLCLYLYYKYAWYRNLPPSSPSILCSFGKGRLGNQMSSFASILSLSKLYGYKAVVTEEQSSLLLYYFEPNIQREFHVLEVEYSEYISSFLGLFSFGRLVWELPWNFDDKKYNFTVSEISKPEYLRGRSIDIGKYPNLLESYIQNLEEIKPLFRFRKRFSDAAQTKLYSAKKSRSLSGDVTFIGVHVRRSDYGQHLVKMYNLTLIDAAYFNRAMEYYRNKFDSIVFAVVSDDLSWARSNMEGEDVFFLGHDRTQEKDELNPLKPGEDIGEDLALLASCNHTIMTYGTFGMWGGLLSGGEVLFPSSFLKTKEGFEVSSSNLIQSGKWVKIVQPELRIVSRACMGIVPANIFCFLCVLLLNSIV
ncbi:galactoside 2-alpha-L-fucosyltransferase 2 [Eurytemora carolleeae]|uniref:galactoside 2-alpha-L-fucosyltransferase 2 n=1 Tax=Eurytemora carolleeae TaxID=1294199 RepID=UPI000C77F236|nr:galactoside 2-alpha-L-fucosyltransferase 2 [Eurytemora carolleeae]|eukprot:XP_023323360.1 galactoside 2-alpha-L-fucosyltransferase 2-like [Eurytemora affinis]